MITYVSDINSLSDRHTHGVYGGRKRLEAMFKRNWNETQLVSTVQSKHIDFSSQIKRMLNIIWQWNLPVAKPTNHSSVENRLFDLVAIGFGSVILKSR